jgi:hypothetical protein
MSTSKYIIINEDFEKFFPNNLSFKRFLEKKYEIIQKKIKKLETNKRVDYLRHKQSTDLTDEEYEAKKRFAKLRLEYCEKIHKIIKNL